MTYYRASSASPSLTVIGDTDQILVDQGAISWTMEGSNVFQQVGSNTLLLLYYNNRVYRKTTAGVWGWWQGAWITCSTPLAESKQGSTIPSDKLIIDHSGNLWGLSSAQVFENGKAAGTTKNAVLLLYWKQKLYYQDSADHWFVWTP